MKVPDSHVEVFRGWIKKVPATRIHVTFRNVKGALGDALAREKATRSADDALVRFAFEVLRTFDGFDVVEPLTKKRALKEKKDRSTSGTRLKVRDQESWEAKFATPSGKLKVKAKFERGRVTLKGKFKNTGRKVAVSLRLGDHVEKCGGQVVLKDEDLLRDALKPFTSGA